MVLTFNLYKFPPNSQILQACFPTTNFVQNLLPASNFLQIPFQLPNFTSLLPDYQLCTKFASSLQLFTNSLPTPKFYKLASRLPTLYKICFQPPTLLSRVRGGNRPSVTYFYSLESHFGTTIRRKKSSPAFPRPPATRLACSALLCALNML